MNAAFIGVESHFVYTRSSFFFIEALREQLGSLEVFPSDWRWIHLPRRKHWDLLVFWQHFPRRWELDCLDASSVVLVPMYDNCPRDAAFWEDYRDCTILCFSHTLAELLRGFGHRVVESRYYPPVPPTSVSWDDGRSAFFWPRKPDLNWSHVQPLLRGTSWTSIHIHRTDNLSEVPLDLPEKEARDLPIVTSTWFDSPSDYGSLLRCHQVFFAPRRYEGIGLSFLEAMGLGMAVIAPDSPTMNEYIRSGQNGYLYDPDHPVAPAWADAQGWGEAARRDSIIGREAWVQSVPGLVDLLVSPGTPGSRSRGGPRRDPRRTRAIITALPGYARYRLVKLLLAARRLLFPRWKHRT